MYLRIKSIALLIDKIVYFAMKIINQEILKEYIFMIYKYIYSSRRGESDSVTDFLVLPGTLWEG